MQEGPGTWQNEVGVVVQDPNPCGATISRRLITDCALTLGRRIVETHSEGSELQEFIMPRAGANRKYKTLPGRPGRTPQLSCVGLLRGRRLSCGHPAAAVITDLRAPVGSQNLGRADPGLTPRVFLTRLCRMAGGEETPSNLWRSSRCRD